MPKLSQLENIAVSYTPYVTNVAYSSYQLYYTAPSLARTSLRNTGKLVDVSQVVVAVTPNFYNISRPSGDIVQVSSADSRLRLFPLITQRLYSRRGYRAAALSLSLKDQLALTSWDDTFLQTNKYTTQGLSKYIDHPMHPIAYMLTQPVFQASRTTTSKSSAVLISFPRYVELSDGLYKSVSEVPISAMYITIDPSSPSSIQSQLLKELRDTLINTAVSVSVLSSDLSGLNGSESMISIVFMIATVLVMLIALFSLNSAMYTNILEQKGEIGILRSLGLTKWALFRLYAYEAFALTIAASFTGVRYFFFLLKVISN